MGAAAIVLAVTLPLSATTRWAPFHAAVRSAVVARSGCSVSHTFCLLFSCASGSPLSKPSTTTRSPMAAPAGGSSGSTLSSLVVKKGAAESETALMPTESSRGALATHVLAHSTMASLMMPRIFEGLRLQSSTTMLPWRSSCATLPTRPLMTVRGFSSPRSMVSTNSLDASGCGLTLEKGGKGDEAVVGRGHVFSAAREWQRIERNVGAAAFPRSLKRTR